MMSEYAEERERAIAALNAGDPQEAFRIFRAVVEYPTDIEVSQWSDALAVLARISEPIAGSEFAECLTAAGNSAEDVDKLYDAAYQLYEQRLHGIAASVLCHANVIKPGESRIVTELSSNLEALMLNGAAADLIRESGLSNTDSYCRYLLAFNSLMTGDLEEPRELLPALRGVDDDDIRFVSGALSGILTRAEALRQCQRLDGTDLTGWHMAINGGVLLHESPHGFDEGMRGRYAYVSDSYGLIREGLQRVVDVLQAAGTVVDRVIACPDRSSRIVGLALARVLEVPAETWESLEARPGLVVAYDMDQIDDGDVLAHLKNHRPGQILWSHAACWTDPFPYTPDVITFQYQTCAAPWVGGMSFDARLERVHSEADDAPEEEIAERVLAADITDLSHSTMEDVRTVITGVAPLGDGDAAGLFRIDGPRHHQRAGSPVQSHRFL